MARALHADIPRSVDEHGQVWFSGDVAAELLLRGFDIVDLLIQPTPEITVYNNWCASKDKLDHQVRLIHTVPEDAAQRLACWHITQPFCEYDVREIVLQRCQTEPQRDRVNLEMDLFEAFGLIPVLRLMFMLVDHFRRNNIVWGVGRGSSVASYVLFLIGIHKIDSLAYGLEISEFLRG